MICPNCGRDLPEGTKFCGGCGTRIAPVEQQTVQYTEPVFDPPVPFDPPVVTEPRNKKEKAAKPQVLNQLKNMVKKIPAKYLKIGGIAAAALVVAIVLICVLTGGNGSSGNGSGQPDGALYLKEGELYYSDFSKKAPYEISKDLLEDADSWTLQSYAYEIAETIHVTEDGKTMFYMDKLSYDGTGTLYWRSLTNLKKEAEKIAAGVSKYSVSENGKLVTYLKSGTLYQYDMKEETKLAKDVETYSVSEDGKIIYYRNDEYTWYVAKDGESEKIGTDISIEYVTEDYTTVYYMNDNKLYRKTIGKDKEKLLSGIEGISEVNEDGTFYYSTSEEIPLSEFFVEDTDEYVDLMETLAEESLYFYELGYFDGKDGTVIGENCIEADELTWAEGTMVLYNQYDISTAGSIGLTKLVEYYYDSDHYYIADAAEDMIMEQLLETEVWYLASNGTTSVLDLEAIYDLSLSEDGKTLYALCAVDEEKEEGTLYKVTISGDKVKSVEEADDEVYSERALYFASYYGSEYSQYFVYYKDVKDDKGDLYANGEMVDSDVYVRNTVRYNHAKKSLVYYVDYSYDKSEGLLKTWDGKKAVEICDDVHYYEITDGGDVYVGYDHSSTKDTVTLASWNGSKLTEICEDVYNYTEISGGDLLISTDYSSKNSSYTLSAWDGKKLTEVSDDVYDYTVMPNDDILYLYDYSTSKYEGELHLFSGKKSEMVDEDVAALIELPGYTTHYFDN